MKVLGLTGGIGSGKTTVAGFFEELGIPVFIADLEAKKIMAEDPRVQEQIVDLLGKEAFENGKPNRKFIAQQVFNDKVKLEQLNAIIHPAVGRSFQNWKRQQKDVPYVVYEAAILFEKGGYKNCDKNLLVTAAYGERIERLQKRDDSTPEEIEARMNNQWSDEKKADLADFIIDNNELSHTRKEVRKLHQIMVESA